MRWYAPILALPIVASALWLVPVVACFGQSTTGTLVSVAKPPRDLARRVARNESLIRELRDQYTFRQNFRFEELAPTGSRTGFYQEVRDVVYSPDKGRDEVLVQMPSNSLQRIRLTEEDFHDVREIQNFLFTEEVLWLYRIRHKGEETIDGEPCWVMHVSPKNELADMRFFEGQLWISKKDEEIVRAAGRAVPEIRTTKSENLFPLFTTVRQRVDGHWMPVLTFADDDLAFSSGRQRVRLQVDFENYKRFGAETSITFGDTVKEGDARPTNPAATPVPGPSGKPASPAPTRPVW